MREYQFQSPFFRRLGYAVWLVLLVMAMVYYKERAFFMDAGFQLFNMINEGAIQVYHYRFVTALPQILPFFLLEMGAPLWALGLGFSVAYLLFYLLVYHLLVRYLNNDLLGWVLLFLFTLISLDTFYHMQSEFYLGLSLLLLVFGIVLRFPELGQKWIWAALLPLLVTVGFSHKLSLVFFLFLWLFLGISNKVLWHRRYLLLLGVFLAVAAFKSIYFTNWYEAAKQVDFQNYWEQYFPNFQTIPANLVFLNRCFHYYYMLPILLALVSIFYIVKKRWLKLALVWSFFLGFLLLYNISDPEAPYRFYSEVTYLPLSIFVATPFWFDVAGGWDKKGPAKTGGYLGIFLISLMALRLAAIAANHRTFGRQYTWIEKKLEQPAGNRFLLKKENVPMDTVLMEWGATFTALHLSSLHGAKHAKTLLILPDFKQYEKELESDSYFLSPFKAIPVEKLNKKYFDLGKGKYQDID
ncbi:MAG: hypothetical protein H6577_11115 [Lewinellaceae bacterium]|nr:hypothetical protein [Saprospiraceae bacterium]MCB9338664.1 hypothetical protein [Lewinellaceae bacterium]